MKKLYTFCIFSICAIFCFSQNAIFGEKIITPGNNPSDFFGVSVAIQDDLLVGTDTSDPNGSVQGTGAAFIYRKNNTGNFIFEQKLKAPLLDTGDSYGTDVAINGNFIAVGALRYKFANNTNGFPQVNRAGAVFLYKFNTNTNQWDLVNQIFAPTRLSNHEFGWRIVLTDTQLFVTEIFFRDTNVNASRTGKVHIYDYDNNGGVTYNQGINNPEPNTDDFFGAEIALSGNSLAIGANGEDFDQNGNNQLSTAGVVYLFEKDGSGLYNLQQKIVPNPRVAFANFGSGLDLDENTLVVGAINETRNPPGSTNTLSSGVAYIFKNNGTSWSQTAIVEPPTIENNANFGRSVNLNNNTVLVGYEGGRVPFNGSTRPSGLVEQITIDDNGLVIERFTIAPPFPDTTDQFGYITSWDGEQLAVGAFADRGDINGNILNESPGAVYVYNLNASLSIDTYDNDTVFKLHPNPAVNVLQVTSNNACSLSRANIYSIDGKMVKKLSTITSKINIEDLKPGIYLLQLKLNNGNQQTIKFIKNQ